MAVPESALSLALEAALAERGISAERYDPGEAACKHGTARVIIQPDPAASAPSLDAAKGAISTLQRWASIWSAPSASTLVVSDMGNGEDAHEWHSFLERMLRSDSGAAKQDACFLRLHGLYGPGINRRCGPRQLDRWIDAIDQGAWPAMDHGPHPQVYIDDAIEAIVSLISSPIAGARIDLMHEWVNNGDEIQAMIRELLGRPTPRLSRRHSSDSEPRRMGAELDRLGLSPRVDHDEGLIRTLASLDFDANESGLPMVPILRPQLPADSRLLARCQHKLVSGQVSNNGDELKRFERELSGYLDCPRAFALSSGAAALTIALRLLPRRGRVLLPAYTYIATLNAVVDAGHEPEFCDIDADTWTLDPQSVAESVRTFDDVVAILPVSVFGVRPDLAALKSLARQAGAQLVHDDAHGFGSCQSGHRLPPEPDFSVFSLHATKLLPAVEGGLLIARDSALNESIESLRNHGLREPRLESGPGMNAKMDELRAMIGAASLTRIHSALRRRRSYLKEFRARVEDEGPGIFVNQVIPGGQLCNGQDFTLKLAPELSGLISTSELQTRFAQQGIASRSYFDPPLHHLPDYRGRWQLPVTDTVWRNSIGLPIHSYMTRRTRERLCRSVVTVSEELAQRLTSRL